MKASFFFQGDPLQEDPLSPHNLQTADSVTPKWAGSVWETPTKAIDSSLRKASRARKLGLTCRVKGLSGLDDSEPQSADCVDVLRKKHSKIHNNPPTPQSPRTPVPKSKTSESFKKQRDPPTFQISQISPLPRVAEQPKHKKSSSQSTKMFGRTATEEHGFFHIRRQRHDFVLQGKTVSSRSPQKRRRRSKASSLPKSQPKEDDLLLVPQLHLNLSPKVDQHFEDALPAITQEEEHRPVMRPTLTPGLGLFRNEIIIRKSARKLKPAVVTDSSKAPTKWLQNQSGHRRIPTLVNQSVAPRCQTGVFTGGEKDQSSKGAANLRASLKLQQSIEQHSHMLDPPLLFGHLKYSRKEEMDRTWKLSRNIPQRGAQTYQADLLEV